MKANSAFLSRMDNEISEMWPATKDKQRKNSTPKESGRVYIYTRSERRRKARGSEEQKEPVTSPLFALPSGSPALLFSPLLRSPSLPSFPVIPIYSSEATQSPCLLRAFATPLRGMGDLAISPPICFKFSHRFFFSIPFFVRLALCSTF